VYLPEKGLEERIKPLMDAGLTEEEALAFDKAHKDLAINDRYNQSIISYATGLKGHPLTTESLFQLTESVDQTASSLDNLEPLFMDEILTDEEASTFILNYPQLVKDDGINAEDTKLLEYHLQFSGLTDTVIKIIPEQNKRLSTLSTLQPSIVEGIIPEEKASNFIRKHPELSLDDGINATDLQFVKAYVSLPSIVDKIIEKVRPEDRLFALDELTPYISKPLTEEQAYQLIESWYPELFEMAKKIGQSVLFGDFDRPEPDGLTNYEEIFELGTDPFKTNNWIKFVFNFTKRPSDFYEGSADTRDLAAAFDYIQLLDKNSSVIKTIEFEPGDEKYLKNGWYGLERWEDLSASWSGNNSIVFMDIPEEAHFLRFKANSIGRTDYQDLEIGFKELISHPNEMKIYFDNKLVDKVPLYGRMQTHYANLRPELDSDGDRIMNKFDINPRIPNPRPIKTNVDIGVYYLTGWGLEGGGKSHDWSLGTPFHSIFGNYTSNDPDIADRQIKSAVENGINIFICPYTSPYWDHSISWWERNLEDGLLRAKFLSNIYWAILYNKPFRLSDVPGIDQSFFDKLTNQTVRYVSENYFDHSSYLKINNKPMFMLYSAAGFYDEIGPETFNSIIDDIRRSANQNGYSVYLVGDVIGTWIGNDEPALTHAREVIDPFDAISAYVTLDAGEQFEYDEKGNVHLVKPYDTMVEGYINLSKWWSTQAKKYSKSCIPPLTTGFDNSIMYEKGVDDWLVIRTNPTPEGYKRMCAGSKPFIDPELNVIIAGAWNEYQEGWVLEPTIEFGFGYLNVLRYVFSAEVDEAIEKGYKFLRENLWDEAKGAYRECPPGSEGLESNYWGDDNYLALIFHRDYERFKDSERANRIQQFLEKNPPRLELGLSRWRVLSAANYMQYQPYNNWEYADQVALDGIYHARIGNIEKAKECFNYLIEKMYRNGLIADEATPKNGHEYYKLALALILAHHLKNEDPKAERLIPILTENLSNLQRSDGSWLTDDKPPSWPNTETTILILIALK